MKIVITNNVVLEATMSSGEKGLMLDIYFGRGCNGKKFNVC